MCGISGYFSYQNRCDTKLFYKAHKKLAHRGPDDEGFIYKNSNGALELLTGDDSAEIYKKEPFIYDKEPSSLILGHRRLSIIDLSPYGHQPFTFKDLSLVYNGEIYNYIELKEKLQSLGYTFETQSDTEVFIKAYHCWGVQAFSKFNGMWAAAVYDHKTQTLLLVRDRFGIKPLYYYDNDKTLIFGSEIKFIAAFFNRLRPNEKMIYEYLRFSYTDHTNETFFKDIYQVEPGCYMIYSKKGFLSNRYWDIETDNESDVQNIESNLRSAIELRLRSDVKVGSLLSGGVDSNAILGFIDHYKLANTFDTFSAVFKEKEFSEKYYIDLVKTKNIKLQKHFIYPDAKKVLRELDELLYIQEEPFRSLSVYSQFKIYQYIKKESDVTVLLNGQGADEIFTGYSEHYYYYLLQLLLEMKLKTFIREYKALKRNRDLSNIFIIKEMFRIFLSLFFQRKNKHKIFKAVPKLRRERKKFKKLLKQKLYHDLTFSALREYLRYEDKNSMAFSLESRLPFLDFRVVSSAFSMQDSDKIKNGVTKYALRESAKGKIPEKTLRRNDKMGFVSPQELWQKDIYKDEFDKVFEEIKENGLFAFLDHERIYDIYKKYQLSKHRDWGLIWRIFLLKQWKERWNLDV